MCSFERTFGTDHTHSIDQPIPLPTHTVLRRRCQIGQRQHVRRALLLYATLIIVRWHTHLTHIRHPLVPTHTHTISNLRWVLLRVRHTVRHTGQLLAARAIRRTTTQNTHRVLHVLAVEEQGAGLCGDKIHNQNTAKQECVHVCVTATNRLYIILIMILVQVYQVDANVINYYVQSVCLQH